MAKRPCISDLSPRVLIRDYDRFNMEALLESLFAVSDSALIGASFDGLVDSRSTDSDQNDLIQRAFHLGSVLFEAGKRSVRKRSSVHNASVWPLPTDLTIKVFSMLDTPSVCSAAATCSFFQNCAIDPLCYTNIELLVPVVDDAVVSTMIQRAGNALQSIKLGVLVADSIGQEQGSFILTSSCLSSLSASGGAIGSQLRRLHLYSIEAMDNITVSASLSVCPSLVDLEIVGLFVEDWDVEVSQTLECVSRYCGLLERFIYQSNGDDDELETWACEKFVVNCPKITTLAIKSCVVDDSDARILVKGFHKLKYVDFSESATLNGSFLKNLGTKGGGKSMEVLIMRECIDLDKVEVKKFMKALLAGKFKLLRHLDISNSDGFAYECNYDDRRYGVSFIPVKELLKQRPNFCLVAELSKKMYANA